MKLHRFIGNFNFNNSRVKIYDGDFLNQARNVLRLGVGESLILCDGNGNEATATIREYNKDFAEVEIISMTKNQNEPERKIVLYCSVLKRENFELVVQKATEVGVSEIVPVISKRTVKLNLRNERLEKIAREAAEQSGRGTVPKLHQMMGFEAALNHARENNQENIFFNVSGKPLEPDKDKKSIGIFIGPEGGWDEEEIKKAHEVGFTIASLGKLTLRSETAAIIAVYLSI